MSLVCRTKRQRLVIGRALIRLWLTESSDRPEIERVAGIVAPEVTWFFRLHRGHPVARYLGLIDKGKQ